MADEQNDEEKGTPAPAEPAEDHPETAAEASAEAAAKADAAEAEEAAAEAETVQSSDEPSTARATPAAILERVSKLGEEDENDRIAREEEEKLAERRAAAKKKSRLESAASKKLDAIGTKPKKKKRPVVEAEADEPKVYNDALYRRTMTLGEWVSKNRKAVGTVFGVAAAAGLVVFGYLAYTGKQNAEASRILLEGTADESGRVGAPAKKDEDSAQDPRPQFETVEAKNAAALAKYREVTGKYKGTGPAILARLAEGSILLDGKDAEGAIAAFEEVQKSPLAQVDNEVRGRALEGLGFAQELKGALDDAAKTYKELENVVEVKGFKELAIYHQARVAEAKGDQEKAKELYKTVHQRVTDPTAKLPFPYLQEAVEDRLRALDPSALPDKSSPFGNGSGASKMNEAQLKKLQEQIQKQMEEAQKKQKEQGGGAPK